MPPKKKAAKAATGTKKPVGRPRKVKKTEETPVVTEEPTEAADDDQKADEAVKVESGDAPADDAAAKAAADRYGMPCYTDMHEMMAEHGDKIDAVIILTESGAHAEHTLELASYGKHIIVEKPMALTLEEADEMIQVCDANGIKLFIVKQNRYNYAVQALRKAFDAGRFGKIVMGTVRIRWCRDQSYYDQADWRGTWAMDGGVFANQASHHIDLLEWFLGPPVSVFATSRTA